MKLGIIFSGMVMLGFVLVTLYFHRSHSSPSISDSSNAVHLLAVRVAFLEADNCARKRGKPKYVIGQTEDVLCDHAADDPVNQKFGSPFEESGKLETDEVVRLREESRAARFQWYQWNGEAETWGGQKKDDYP